MKELIIEIEKMAQPTKRGHYGPHDQLHIQHNIGYNQALVDVISRIESLQDDN